jgi:16S rRNA (cytosine1402-N4)-methyltransferase
VLTHVPVLLDEVLAALRLRADGRYLDATFGRGGHTAEVLARLGPQGRVVALDRDPQAVAAGRARFGAEARVQLLHGHFGHLRNVLSGAGVGAGFDGVLFDLGVSSPQLDDAERGFSFYQDGPLDMRMDNSTGVTAAAWLAKISERDLTRVLFEFGEERFAKRIARFIDQRRRQAPITTTGQLAAVVAEAVPRREPGKHPATRTFQAIRIAVNGEFDELQQALDQTLELLAPGGRLCAISFHSLEDRIVKQFMQKQSQDDPMYAGLPNIPPEARAKLKRIGRAVHPSAAEIAANPRARSAVLRVAEKAAA